MTDMRNLIPTAILAAAVAALLGTAPTAAATSDDDAFLQTVAEHGFVSNDGNPRGLITLAHIVCGDLGIGMTLMEEVRKLQYYNPGVGLAAGDAAYFIGAAHGSYCPWVDIAGTSVA